jgi:translation initiation factor 2A
LTYKVSGQGSKSAQTSSKAPVNIAPKPAGAYRPPQSKFTAALNDKVYLKDMSNSSFPGY